MDKAEKRIRTITNLHYSNQNVQKALLNFAKDREVVPRYYELFGKRPDIFQYLSDINGAVKRGATSFHASEELWEDPLQLNSELSFKELNSLRRGWDLVIDIDSKFLDYSKIAAMLIIQSLEFHRIKNYKIKFSGSKGFHIILPDSAFPKEYGGVSTKEMFPEWPRAICEYLIEKIRPAFNERVSREKDIDNLIIRTGKKKEDLLETICPQCGKAMEKQRMILTKCKLCGNQTKLKEILVSRKRILRCMLDNAPLEITDKEDFFECNNCKISTLKKFETDHKEKLEKEGRKSLDNYRSDIKEGIKESERGNLDLVLVASRHLFRMPYSLHEKTSLVSVVLEPEEIEKFNPRNAEPLNVKVKDFLPKAEPDEARKLLAEALEWKKNFDNLMEKSESRPYKTYEKINFKIEESSFPNPIKKLLKGLEDGKKRGLFILITFLRCSNYSPEEVIEKVSEWNKKNNPPLKEGYIRSQLDWHFKQKKQILPPNYSNDGFYRDLALFSEKPKAKNPLAEAIYNSKRA
ncbi:hypothetical protein HY450_02740 [Candidatus Pacearchaeota archaeon]|nr:hypothetical protein [Candidatus Pacearchaeota archaeon]